MPTPTGSINFQQIAAEFGPSASPLFSVRLGSYRVSQFVAGRSWPLDTGVPTSGPISMSQLRGKTLNVVVDYPSTEYGVNSASTYDSRGVPIGVNKIRPASSSSHSKKVYHVVRGKIGSIRTLTSITPTSPLTVSATGFVRGTPNTLGQFIIQNTALQPSQYGTQQVCTTTRFGRQCYYPLPPQGSSTSSVYGTVGVNGAGGSGAQINMRRDRTTTIRYQSTFNRGGGGTTTVWRTITDGYYVTGIIAGGNGYALNGTVSASYDGRTFTFTVNGVSGGNSFVTGGWGSNTTLQYLISGVISGAGGNGGRGGANNAGEPGTPGSPAFIANASCAIRIESGGRLSGGGGGGGGGGFTYNPTPDARFCGSGGGGGAGIPPGGGGIAGNMDGGRYGNLNLGSPGSAGTETSGGPGGNRTTRGTASYPGGPGGNPDSPGQPGVNGNNQRGGSGGGAGARVVTNGHSVIFN